MLPIYLLKTAILNIYNKSGWNTRGNVKNFYLFSIINHPCLYVQNSSKLLTFAPPVENMEFLKMGIAIEWFHLFAQDLDEIESRDC